MKYLLLGIISLAVFANCYADRRHSDNSGERSLDPVDYFFEYFDRHQSLLIAALNNASLSQYVYTYTNFFGETSQRVNTTGLCSNLYNVLPAISSYLNQSMPTDWQSPYVKNAISQILTVIQNVQQNTNGTQSQLGGYLIFKGYSNNVSCGASGGLTVNLSNVVANANQSALLNEFIKIQAAQLAMQQSRGK